MPVADRSRSWSTSTAAVLVALAAGGCTGSRMASDCCAPQQACCPAPAAEPCSPCGPRPSHAKPGEAWCCVWVPPVDVPQVEEYCTKPASKRCVWVPPAYGTRIKLVCEEPARLEQKNIPGVYAQRKRDVLLTPEKQCIQRIECPPGELAPGERQMECLVKRVTPAVWGQECERVCLEADRRCVQFTPAQYRCVEERYMISPGFTQEICEPAEYAQRERTVCIQPGRWEWRLNEKCKVPEPALKALQSEMVDSNPDGSPAGIFKVGTQVRYDVTISSDSASGALRGLQVHFTLPPELEFADGSGERGVTVSGGGQTALSSAFDLAGDQSLKLHILVNVKSAPKGSDVQVVAKVRDADGDELAIETESTTLQGAS